MHRDHFSHHRGWAPLIRESLRAVLLAAGGRNYKGKASPHWHDEDSFCALLHAAGLRPVREVIAEFDGLSGAKAGVVTRAFLGRAVASLDRAEAACLLATARAWAREVTPQRLGWAKSARMRSWAWAMARP
jgi:hypothetical protein